MCFTQDNFEIRKAKVVTKSFPSDTIGKIIIVIYVNPTHLWIIVLNCFELHHITLHYSHKIDSFEYHHNVQRPSE